jgi:hypothetical protein
MSESKGSRAAMALRVLVIVALLLSAYVHIKYAHFYKHLGKDITQGTLFYLQGALAIVAAVLLALNGKLLGWAPAAVVLLGSFAAIMVYRYIDVGSVGPLPNMYEPIWDPQGDGLKLAAAFSEGIGTALAFSGLVIAGLGRRSEVRG